MFLAVSWDARMAYLHVFCCILPLLLVFCRGILAILFKRYLSSVLVVPLPPGSPAVWPCVHSLGPAHCQSLGFPDGCLWTLVRAGTFLPCCYNWAQCWVPRCLLHLLSVVKASRALAVAQWPCCQNPGAFLASTLSGSSRCWDFSKPLRPWEQENGRLT